MRRILIALLFVIGALLILWIFAGRQISERFNQLATAKIGEIAVNSIQYQGSGEGGALTIAGREFPLTPLQPRIGSTKENELALAYKGKVFAFGPLRSTDDELLVADVPKGDSASLISRQDHIRWPRARRYDELYWTKASGQRLDVLWSFEEVDRPGGATNLIRVEILDASR